MCIRDSRRSSRVAARMQKTAQQAFDEKIANGTMTKEALLNAPKCLRNFDEAEDAILAQSDEEDEDEDEDEDDDDDDDEAIGNDMSILVEDPVLLKLIVSKLPHALVAAIIQQIILELDDLEKDAHKRGILLNQLKDQLENMLLSQTQKSESKGIFSLKMRK